MQALSLLGSSILGVVYFAERVFRASIHLVLTRVYCQRGICISDTISSLQWDLIALILNMAHTYRIRLLQPEHFLTFIKLYEY